MGECACMYMNVTISKEEVINLRGNEENKKCCWGKGISDNDVNLVLMHEMLKDKRRCQGFCR